MKKQLLLVFMLFVFQSSAQTFQNIYHYAAITDDYVVEQTMDGGYVLLTWTADFGAGNADIYLIKINSSGDTAWTRTYGGLENDYGNFIRQTADSGYIIAGDTRSFGGVNHGYLLKVNSTGNVIWSRTYGGIYTSIFNSVDITNDGGYIAAGWTNDFGVSVPDYYVVKTDSLGNILWTKTFDSSNSDVACSVKQTNSGKFIIAGHSINSGIGTFDIYLIKINSTGNLIWSKSYGGSMEEVEPKIILSADNGIILTATTESFGAGMHDVLLMKTDSNGIVSWAKTFGGASDDRGHSVQQTSDGGYIITGYTSSFGAGLTDIYLIKTDIIGDIVFTKTFGTPTQDIGWSVIQCSDGGYGIAGETMGFGISGYGFYFIKTDSAGYGGCNEITVPTITANVLLQGVNQVTQVSSGGTDSIVTTLNGSGGLKTALCSTVGAVEYDFPDPMVIFPVPVFDEINISGINLNSVCEVQIINPEGKVHYQYNLKIVDPVIKLKNLNLTSGIYFVKVFDGEKSYCKKLIVGHD